MENAKNISRIKYDTVWLEESNDTLAIIDQIKLPNSTEILYLCDEENIYTAIKTLQVRGAPAIGVAAAIGLYAVAARFTAREER